MPDESSGSLELVLEALVRGDRATVASCLNDVEDRRPEARARSKALLKALSRSKAGERAHRIGVTGPPGVGKSSLVSALVRVIRGAAPSRSIGILAVDPSSLRSGGALLGDRLRIQTGEADPGVFIRSLATRGELGGLARAVASEVVVLSAAFDVALVETVGVGQNETDVRDVVDTLVFVVQPGAGDTLQHLKSGVMETPDVLVVNKADLGDAAERTRAELRAALSSLSTVGAIASPPPLLTTSAKDGLGIQQLLAALDTGYADLQRTGALENGRRRGELARAVRELKKRYGELGVERLGGEGAVERALEGLLLDDDVMSAVDRLNPFEAREV